MGVGGLAPDSPDYGRVDSGDAVIQTARALPRS
jgi:hypothetical protein